jgi:hypothetical protein
MREFPTQSYAEHGYIGKNCRAESPIFHGLSFGDLLALEAGFTALPGAALRLASNTAQTPAKAIAGRVRVSFANDARDAMALMGGVVQVLRH